MHLQILTGTKITVGDFPRIKEDNIMTEERITERTDPMGNVVERTIERNDGAPAAAPASSGGGTSMFVILLMVLALAIGGFFIFGSMSESEAKKDNAVAEAADNVGAAAKKVGDSVEKAVDNVGGN